MSKLVPLEEAARLLGISADRLTEMRSKNEIFGYRDGTNWKFKMSELERVADELGVSLGDDNGNVLDDDVVSTGGSSFQMTESAKKMLVDDAGSGISGIDFTEELASTKGSDKNISGKTSDLDLDFPSYQEKDSVELIEDSSVELFNRSSFGDSNINLEMDEPESIELELADSGLLTPSPSDRFKNPGSSKIQSTPTPSDDILDDEEDLSFGASSLRLASESSRKLGELAEDDLNVIDEGSKKVTSPSDTGKLLSDDLSISEDDLFNDELSLVDSSSDSGELSSDFTDSGDLVLEDSDSSTELRLEDSGINLSPSESGIMLQDDVDLSGGSDIYSLELPEDEDIIVVDSGSDDEFNLTPLADPLEEEESTGSQVIALEDSEIYADESSDGMLVEEDFSAQPAFAEANDDNFGMGLVPAGMAAAGAAAVVPETPYDWLSITLLGAVTSILGVGLMVAYGVCQNLWMPEDQIMQSSALNFFLRILQMDS